MGGEPLAGGRATAPGGAPDGAQSEAGVAKREADAIYQQYRQYPVRPVARVLEAEVDEAAKEVRFGEIYNSDDLVLADECEFQKYRILVRRIGYATRFDKEAPHKGRVLRGVTAEILGYREH